MKEANFQPKVVKLVIYRPGDFSGAWKVMKISFKAALALGASWFLATAVLM